MWELVGWYLRTEYKQSIPVLQDNEINWIVTTRPMQTLPNLCITNVVLSLNVNNRSYTMVTEPRGLPLGILETHEKPGL